MRLPRQLTATTARQILPALQRAVVLATTGGDRYERTFVDPDTAPVEPLCVRCYAGTGFDDIESRHEVCARDGHTPFGEPAATSWEQAQQTYGRGRPIVQGAGGPRQTSVSVPPARVVPARQ